MLLHNASGQEYPRPDRPTNRPQRHPPTKSEPGAPLWGRRAGDGSEIDGLRVRRSQRRSDGCGRLRGSRAGRTPRAARSAVEVGPLAVGRAVVSHGVLLPVVMASVMTVVAGDLETGEEDAHCDEHDAGDDHDPRRESVEPIGFDRHSRWLGGDGSRPGFRCFTHAQMMRGQRIGRARYNL